MLGRQCEKPKPKGDGDDVEDEELEEPNMGDGKAKLSRKQTLKNGAARIGSAVKNKGGAAASVTGSKLKSAGSWIGTKAVNGKQKAKEA